MNLLRRDHDAQAFYHRLHVLPAGLFQLLEGTFQRLLAEMRAGKAAPIPRTFHQHGRAYRDLREPLTFVPHGTVVSMKVEVPDNNGGKLYHLGWVCNEPAGLPPDEARQQLMELLVPRFLDLVMPLPD